MRLHWRTLIALIVILAMATTACGSDDATTDTQDDSAAGAEGDGAMAELSGTIEIDGSSTVGPLTDAIAEEFAAVAPDVVVNLGISGTGGGFERFCVEGSTDISNASRPIKDSEAQLCADNGVEFTEVRVGTDALTMVTNNNDDFLSCLTTEELVTLWGPDGATTWDQVNPDFPAEPIAIFAPDADSGTYDFFNETILDPSDIEEPRQDYNASADDNIISQGVQGTPGSWGYFGFAYFVNNPGGVKAVEYDAGEGCVAPSEETAQDGTYGLTRPLYIYIRNDALQSKPELAAFANFYLDIVNDIIEEVGYVPVPQEVNDEARATLQGAQ